MSNPSKCQNIFFQKIKSKKINIGIIGLGFILLPLAIKILNKNYNVQMKRMDNKLNLIIKRDLLHRK